MATARPAPGVTNTDPGRTVGMFGDVEADRLKHHLKRLLRPLRTLTAGLRMRPDFAIIGARKAGTTSLYNYLLQHLHVLRALEKEVHYFDRHAALGPAWYLGHFPTRALQRLVRARVGDPVVTGEATPDYLDCPGAVDGLYRVNPQIRLIVLLRDPVDRAVSAFYHGVRLGTPAAQAFRSAAEAELAFLAAHADRLVGEPAGRDTVRRRAPLLGRGLYAAHLEAWVQRFGPDQLLVLSSEALFRDPAAGFSRVLRFLDLPAFELAEYRRFNSNEYPEIESDLRERLEDFFARPNARLRELLAGRPGWDDPDAWVRGPAVKAAGRT